jgi:hypothetical protein
MRLGRRILDLVRAVAQAAPRTLTSGRSEAGRDGEAARIERALIQAEARRRRLEEHLAAAEQAGRTEEAQLDRRQIDELAHSAEGLRQALERMAARREVAGAAPPVAGVVAPPGPAEPEPSTGDVASSGDADLDARKRRLSDPG